MMKTALARLTALFSIACWLIVIPGALAQNDADESDNASPSLEAEGSPVTLYAFGFPAPSVPGDTLPDPTRPPLVVPYIRIPMAEEAYSPIAVDAEGATYYRGIEGRAAANIETYSGKSMGWHTGNQATTYTYTFRAHASRIYREYKTDGTGPLGGKADVQIVDDCVHNAGGSSVSEEEREIVCSAQVVIAEKVKGGTTLVTLAHTVTGTPSPLATLTNAQNLALPTETGWEFGTARGRGVGVGSFVAVGLAAMVLGLL
ncbi:hypothetical protein CC1G_06176 [Coprinopsis cinerea okayama7|uniref:Secreted protein n=1 Tax=Coprinopsis cinerea (strain Okayama-7 / 130 / ATCC MYA-4618 / FGSC 9003) TaxID=240176 RepID=A8NV32_COPC7|nr:hypothetical protein CC1G_06176 [Coprinopsis cinerea okayama7\|eukprot:XP_001836589.1 hypothetical protein CC1G_06176 [Coprinopsis cinerea okayama7\